MCVNCDRLRIERDAMALDWRLMLNAIDRYNRWATEHDVSVPMVPAGFNEMLARRMGLRTLVPEQATGEIG